MPRKRGEKGWLAKRGKRKRTRENRSVKGLEHVESESKVVALPGAPSSKGQKETAEGSKGDSERSEGKCRDIHVRLQRFYRVIYHPGRNHYQIILWNNPFCNNLCHYH